MDPSLQATIDQLIAGFNTGDIANLRPLFGPNLEFFGSLIRSTVQGPGGIAAAFDSARNTFGIRSIEPILWFGDHPELAGLAFYRGEGGHPTIEGALAVRFNDEGKLIRLGAYWEPGAFVRGKQQPEGLGASRTALTDKDPRVQAILGTYFEAFNKGDEAAHFSVMHPDLTYYGSLAKVRTNGVESARGVYQAATLHFGVREMRPKQFFGDWPEVAVTLDLARGPEDEGSASLFVFQFNPQGQIIDISAFWQPRELLRPG